MQAAEKQSRLKAELGAMRGRLEEANQKYRGATEQVSTLKQRVTEEEAARQAGRAGAGQATSQLEAEPGDAWPARGGATRNILGTSKSPDRSG